MEKVDDKKKKCEQKQQTSETSNLESASSSYNAFSVNSEIKVNMKGGRINKSNDGQNMSEDDCQLINVEEKSSLSSDEYENDKELEMSLPSQHTDGSDESEDVVEHDVKVCDTCGDAGREDLLATCSRCIDGAEHTYCMKESIDQVPKGYWLCEECKLEDVKNLNRASGKRRPEELVSSSSFKKQAVDVDHEKVKVKPIHQVSSDSYFGNESTEGSRSSATRPHLQSLRGAFSKSSSFSFSNTRSKTKLVDEVVLRRQKSTNLGSLGPSGSKVKMLSPKSPHFQDLKSPKINKERIFEKTNSVKLNSFGSNGEVKPVKGDSKIISGLKSTNRSVNITAEDPVSLAPGQFNEQLPTSPPRNSSKVNPVDQKSVDFSSKVPTSKESTNLADVITTGNNLSGLKTSKDVKNRENKLKDAIEAALLKKPGIYRKNKVPETMNNEQLPSSPTRVSSSVSSVDQNSVDFSSKVPISKESTNLADEITTGNNVSGLKSLNDVKNRDNKLKDAIEAALLKKPRIYKKNKVPGQPAADELTMNNNNNEPHLRSTGTLTSADVASSDWHSKQSNGNMSVSGHDDVALSYLKHTPIPDHECIWQGSFEINRSGKTAEFWDGLQAHLSSCASRRVYETVNKLPHKILLNGVSRVSAWPTQFENNGVKENNIGVYFFAKDIESYEKSYQVLLEEMMRGDLALIGSINGVELLIFPSNRLPEKSNRWNMLFFLWGVFRGNRKNSLHQIPNSISRPVDNVNVVPVNSKEMLSESEPIKRPFIDLSEDANDANDRRNTDTWHDASGQQEGNLSKKQKGDFSDERPYKKPVFPLDLNEDITCVVGETDNIVMTKKDRDDDVASTLSLSLAFSPPNKDDERGS